MADRSKLNRLLLHPRTNANNPDSENERQPAAFSIPERNQQKADYFAITVDDSAKVGKEAAQFTANALGKPFTVWTAWRKALGRSTLQRYYACVEIENQKDLGETLVSAGLAKVFGVRITRPDGMISRTRLLKLKFLETEAAEDRRGAWKYQVEAPADAAAADAAK